MEAQAPSTATATGAPDSSSTKTESGLPEALSGPGNSILGNDTETNVPEPSQAHAPDGLNKLNGTSGGGHEQTAAHTSLSTSGSTAVEQGGSSVVAPDTATSSSKAPVPSTSEVGPSIGDEEAAVKDVEQPHRVGGATQPVSNFAPLSTDKPTSPPLEKAPDATSEAAHSAGKTDNLAPSAPESTAAASTGATNGATVEGGGAKRKADEIVTDDTPAANGGADDAQQTSRPIKKQKKGGLAGKVASAVDKVKEKITPKKTAPKKERAPVGKTERRTRSQAAL